MRILYTTTIGRTMNFFKPLIKELIDEGHTVDIATNETDSKIPDTYKEWGCTVYPISWSRSPFSKGNITAVKELKKVVKNGSYDMVHCHTPICAIITRIACRNFRKNGLKVIYTAHGFHFYKGAPSKNWLVYYPIEKICAHWTDVLITINKEDYKLAKKKLKAKKVEYVPGVGIDTKRFADVIVDREKKREEIGIPKDAKMILSVGELNDNKNHRIVIEALGKLSDSNVHYVVAGVGDQKGNLESLAQKSNVRLHLLGYRRDVAELYKCADLYVHPSLREGLPVALMEAIASKLNCVCSNIRGCSDLVMDGLFDPLDSDSLKTQLLRFFEEDNYPENYAHLKKFDLSCIDDDLIRIYENETGGH